MPNSCILCSNNIRMGFKLRGCKLVIYNLYYSLAFCLTLIGKYNKSANRGDLSSLRYTFTVFVMSTRVYKVEYISRANYYYQATAKT